LVFWLATSRKSRVLFLWRTSFYPLGRDWALGILGSKNRKQGRDRSLEVNKYAKEIMNQTM